jgi:hypothetical protein
MPSSEMLHGVALVRTNASEKCIASIIRMKGISELETTLAMTSNSSVLQLLITANTVPRSPSLLTLMMEGLSSSETSFLQEPHGVTFQKTPFFSNRLS